MIGHVMFKVYYGLLMPIQKLTITLVPANMIFQLAFGIIASLLEIEIEIEVNFKLEWF